MYSAVAAADEPQESAGKEPRQHKYAPRNFFIGLKKQSEQQKCREAIIEDVFDVVVGVYPGHQDNTAQPFDVLCLQAVALKIDRKEEVGPINQPHDDQYQKCW